jgi:hypothetical protein
VKRKRFKKGHRLSSLQEWGKMERSKVRMAKGFLKILLKSQNGETPLSR